MLVQIISILGSLGVLAAYAASQFRWLTTTSLPYALLNLMGSGILSAIAIIERQWGFLLLEGVWALLSLGSVIQIARGRVVRGTPQ
ncbi:MAG TPA: hypothetical protein VFY89_04135 [Ktedonobacterales bacterium]